MTRPMMSIARRNMATTPGRTAFTVGGLAVATLLMAFMLALYQGFRDRISSYVSHVPADIWVVRAGNESFFNPSILNNATVAGIQNVDGVTGMDALLVWSLKLKFGGQSWDTYVIGFENGVGGPVKMNEGRGTPGTGEIVIDEVLARRAGIELGDDVGVGLRRLRVVGIASGGNLVITQLSFVHRDEARILVGLEGFVNFALVQAEPGRVSETVDALNQQVPGAVAFDRDSYASSSRQVLEQNLLPILAVVMVLACGVGTVVVGLTTYTTIIEREREFGVLKALGSPFTALMRIVLEQCIACAVAGFVAGQVAALLLARATTSLVPQFVTLFRWQDAALVLVLALAMSVLSSLAPVYRMVRVDPLSVFKA